MLSYLIVPTSFAYFPRPHKGGTASMKEMPQIIYTYRDVKYVTCVSECHDLAYFTTESNLITAIIVRVHKELIPRYYK